ncbi:MAG: NAD-dependent epimerase/dehydratase family protein [Sphingobacteriales bacterium]|uniref:NAD-dependent epimerase/dehydratase family protein n=1 Tax=Hydrotalea flava TaxID=714549 RepID=UPI0008378098|nr:NAD-dependent epimerase/dehydratase family protein [Hydrotalea flava]RTL48440.1 MAG: NAD-dependent epimerase/dehydratase family protein [Sphingobacteriales bacterium]
MKKKVFITGGTGFLGQAVIKKLKKENFELLGLARSESSKNKLLNYGVKPIEGSLENIREWENVLKDVDVVIHLAAPVEFWGPWEKYQKGIVEATQNLYLASEKHHVSQFIYISSESVLQDKKDLIDIDETEPYPKEPNSYYGKSKMLAEKFILNQQGKMKSIILRPTFIWGKGVKALDTIIEKIKSNDFMWIDKGKSWFEMVHVDNVAHAIYLSILNGQNKDKEIYFVTDDYPQTVRSFLTKLIQTRNINPPDKSIPKWLALFLAIIIELIRKTLNIKKAPMITRFDVAFVAMSRKYNINKIKHELKYSPVVSEVEGLREMKYESF